MLMKMNEVQLQAAKQSGTKEARNKNMYTCPAHIHIYYIVPFI